MATARKTAAAKESVEQVVEAGREHIENAMKVSTEAATKNFEKTYEYTKKQMDDAVKGYDEMASVQKENIDAFIASGNAAAKGMEALNAEVIKFSKKSVDDSIAAVKALSGAKNLKEYFDIQSSLVKDQYDSFVSESGKISELAIKVANEVFEPVNARMAVAVEQFSKPLAR